MLSVLETLCLDHAHAGAGQFSFKIFGELLIGHEHINAVKGEDARETVLAKLAGMTDGDDLVGLLRHFPDQHGAFEEIGRESLLDGCAVDADKGPGDMKLVECRQGHGADHTFFGRAELTTDKGHMHMRIVACIGQ